MPPDRYIVVALEALEPGDERNPDVLEQLKSIGTSVSLQEGQTRTLDLKLAAY